MRIHIIGGSGSGKSYVAKKISKKYHLEIIDLDEIEWKDNYTNKTPLETRKKKLKKRVKKDQIVVEGVYYNWIDESLKVADYIFFLEVPYSVQKYRILKRSLFRKLGIYKTDKKESIKSIKALLKWNKEYNTVLQPEIKKVLEPYKNKVYNVKRYEEIIEIIGGIK